MESGPHEVPNRNDDPLKPPYPGSIRTAIRAVLELEKPYFDYTNYVLRGVAWWAATAVAWSFASRIPEALYRSFALAGVGACAIFGSVLALRLLLINRSIADAIAWRVHKSGALGMAVAVAVSFILLLPFLSLVVLLISAINKASALKLQ